ncbi:MAG: hypothetical protein N2D54_05225, partial [Chloroflexota bacterium]
IVLTVITALIHLVWLNVGMYNLFGKIDTLFTLNGIGYFILLAAFMGKIPQLAGKDKLVHFGLIAFTVATIIAFFVFGDLNDKLGLFTKAVEVLLVIFTYMHLKKI